MPTYCDNCGEDVTEDSNYCSNCGSPISESDKLLSKISLGENDGGDGGNGLLRGSIAIVLGILVVLAGVGLAYQGFVKEQARQQWEQETQSNAETNEEIARECANDYIDDDNIGPCEGGGVTGNNPYEEGTGDLFGGVLMMLMGGVVVYAGTNE